MRTNSRVHTISTQEQIFEITEGQNALTVHLKNYTWVSIYANNKKLISLKSSSPVLSVPVSPGIYLVKTDGQIENITSEAVEILPSLSGETQEPLSFLRLTSDAPDQHIVDGIGEVPADGTSFCTISIEKLSFDGTPLTSNEHQDELFIRTTGGIVMDESGENRIRSLQLQSGQAKFRLVSEPNPKVVTVSVFGRTPQQKAEIQIEFI